MANPKVEPRLPGHIHACLQVLVKKGYAKDAGGVAHYLIVRGIDDLKRANVLKPEEIEIEEQDSG